MNTKGLMVPLMALATSIAMSGCNFCGAEEEHAITLSSRDSITVISGDVTWRIGGSSRLTSPPTSLSAVQFVFNTLEGSTSGEGISLGFSGPPTATSNDLIVVGLALPVSLRRGEESPVGATFAIEPRVDGDAGLFGPYDLQQANQAEAALTIATYSFPPALFTVQFR